ncbi:MAG: hypothetical protein JSV49_07920 [Thermoplasmata archaeon]|nr:MAG: hypothetical protein JSV49_07920 [Thermoplasmata archaeon]
MPRCLKCNSVMFHIEQADRWFCERCGEYDTHQSPAVPPAPPPPPPTTPPGGYPPYPPPMIPPKKSESSTLMIILGAVLCTLIILLALIGVIYYYVWSINQPPDQPEGYYFPSIEVEFYDLGTEKEDNIIMAHKQGDPIIWVDYKIIITNNTDESTMTFNDLTSLNPNKFTCGDKTTINQTVLSEYDMDFEKGFAYTLDIYHKQERRRESSKNIICE